MQVSASIESDLAAKGWVRGRDGNWSHPSRLSDKVAKFDGMASSAASLIASTVSTVSKSEILARPTTDEDALNKTEKAFLAWLRRTGQDWLGVQNVTLKLGHDLRLTADFVALKGGQVTFYDVKGFQREDALVKMKAAARVFTWAKFSIVKRKAGGGWDFTEVKP